MIQIDVVIPSAGRADDLLRLLDSLAAQGDELLRDHVQSITVSDDRYRVETGRRVHERHPHVRYVRGPARGPAANRNRGAAVGVAPWILFLDDDCYARPGLIQAYLAAAADVQVLDYLEGAIEAEGPRPSANHHAPLNPDGGRLWACNFLIRRARFVAMGGFDERFPHAALEDCEIHQRLELDGARGRFVASAAVVHPWRSLSEVEITRQIIGHAIMAEKHPSFGSQWSWMNLLRMIKGRAINVRDGGFAAVPADKLRTQAYFAIAPFLMFLAVHAGPLRRHLVARHANRIDGGPHP